MKIAEYELQVVNRVPLKLQEGILYACFDCNVIVHLCACGCGEKVVLPIDPEFWKVQYDGETVSLQPSIGNYQFPCQSHYWIEKNRVKWAHTQSPYSASNKQIHVKQKSGFMKKLKSLFY